MLDVGSAEHVVQITSFTIQPLIFTFCRRITSEKSKSSIDELGKMVGCNRTSRCLLTGQTIQKAQEDKLLTNHHNRNYNHRSRISHI